MNTYQEAIEFLNAQLPIFHRDGKKAFKNGLDNILQLCNALGNPQNQFPAIHIAGTNGKGSTSHFIASAFQENGYKTGLYTSPHLIDLRERIRINGVPIDREFVIRFLKVNEQLILDIQPSYFELNVAMAFLAFAEQNVDIAIIEAGLGGRLDSTNIIKPVLSVITNIGLDHTDILGETVELIATEKAGIIKEGVPVVIGETQAKTEKIFLEKAMSLHSPIYFAESFWELIPDQNDRFFQKFKAVSLTDRKIIPCRTDLLGTFQKQNLKTSLTATQILHELGWNLPLDKVMKSFEHVKGQTGLQGRWDWVRTEPNIILDVAHNADGIGYLMHNIHASHFNSKGKLHIILGFVKDKDVAAALSLFPDDAQFYFTQAKVPRALASLELEKIATTLGKIGASFPEVEVALKAAKVNLKSPDTLLITGSFFIVGEAMEKLEFIFPK